MFNCPGLDLPEATIKEQPTEDCSQFKGTSLTELEPSIERCEVRALSHCSIFGYATIFDGLGHYFNKLRTLMLGEHKHGIYRSYKAYFEEFVGLSAMHLKMPNLPHNASLYCHQKQLASADGFSSNKDLWERQYECNLVPPLDAWFNLRSELFDPNQDEQCVQVKVHRTSLAAASAAPKPENFLRERYWAKKHMHASTACRNKLKPKRSSGDWDVAIHFRLGDLIAPAIGTGDALSAGSREQRKKNWEDRAEEAAGGMRSVLRTLSKTKASLNVTMQGVSKGYRFMVLVVSDSPFAAVQEFIERGDDIRLEAIRTDHDQYATFTTVRVRFVEDSDKVFELAFMSSDANPLVAMHCLAAADALVLPFHQGARVGPSSFALMAATLGRGSVIQTAEELLGRVSHIDGSSPYSWADSFVEHVLSPQGTFAAEIEDGAYPQQRLPTTEDPL